MLRTSIVSKNCFRKYGIGKRGLNLIFNEIQQYPQLKSFCSFSFYGKILFSRPLKYSSVRKLNGIGICSSQKYSSAQVVAKHENNVQDRSHFQEMLHNRKMQAQRSVVVEVATKEDISFALNHFGKYGSIVNMYSYSGENENYFLLLEFLNEMEANNLISNCGFENIQDAFTIRTRIIKFVKKDHHKLPDVNSYIENEGNSESSFQQGSSVSDVIKSIYSTEKLSDLDIRLRFLLCTMLRESISSLFKDCDVLPFGSSVNGIGRYGCDLDIVIRTYPEKRDGDGDIFCLNKTCVGKQKSLQQRTLSRLGEYFLFLPGVSILEKIMFARVPILKMMQRHLNLDFDVSCNNMVAILMSDVIHYCGEIDPRVRPLMYAVKKWAKEANITLKIPGSQITNFGLVNLVLFFLQTRKPYPIVPPLNDVFVTTDSDNGDEFKIRYLKSIEDWQTSASLNKESLAELLKEFFIFLSKYPFHDAVISLLSGGSRPREDDCTPFHIQYPLDESLNITKNISKAEYDVLVEKASISAKYLENNSKQKVNNMKDFSALLGIPSISRISSYQQKFNVNSVLENGKTPKNRNERYRV